MVITLSWKMYYFMTLDNQDIRVQITKYVTNESISVIFWVTTISYGKQLLQLNVHFSTSLVKLMLVSFFFFFFRTMPELCPVAVRSVILSCANLSLTLQTGTQQRFSESAVLKGESGLDTVLEICQGFTVSKKNWRNLGSKSMYRVTQIKISLFK